MSDIYLSLSESPTVVTLSQPVVSGVLSSNVTVANVVSVNVVTMPAITVQAAAPSVTTVAGTVAVSNFPASSSVTIANFPSVTTVAGTVAVGNFPSTQTIAGTVTAQLGSNPFATSVTVQTITGGQNGFPVAYGDQLGVYEVTLAAPGSYCIQSGFLAGPNFVTAATLPLTTPFSETVVTSASILGGLLFRKPPVDGNNTHFRITATTTGMTPAPFNATVRAISDAYYGLDRPVSGTVTVGNSVTIGSLPAISGTVTANNPNGALTTRFGSVTTANTAQITSAVTNTSRKYLLAQNISTGTVTIGIGFSPTTTQGIQLTAGAGLTFDAFCPTGAVYWLGAVTGAAWTILEG